jgi:hypothetical protein
MSWLNLDNVLSVSIALFASFAIFELELYFLKRRPAAKRSDQPASFFDIEELASTLRVRALLSLYALPAATLFLVLALTAKPFVDAAKSFLSIQIVGAVGGEQARKAAEDVLNNIPPWLNPVFVLAATLILFAPVIRTPFQFLRTLVLFAIGIESRANQLSIAAAREALRGTKFDKLQDKFKEKFGTDPPLPEELVSATDSSKLAYQLLYFSSDDARNIGLTNSIGQTLEKIDIAPQHRPIIPPRPPRYRDLLAAFIFYSVLCVAYVFVAPLIAPWIQASPTVRSLLQVVEWPQTSDALVLSVVQRTFSFVVPLALGMQYYANQVDRTQNLTERLRRIAIVFSWQFLISGLINLMFMSLLILKRREGELHDALISFSDIKIWADIFTSSIAPGLALSAWVACDGLKQRWFAYLMLCATAAAAFCFGQFAYEGISGTWRGYYWHQLVMGLFLSVSYLCGALIARDAVTTAKEGPKSAQQTVGRISAA